MRGTSGGMLMLNAFAGITGVALAAPFLATVGLLLGRKALKDERTRQLLQRRNLARQTVRKYADDLTFGVGKDSRDTLRRINRQLRDHFLKRAEELTSSTSESLAATQQAVRSSEAARTERRREVVALLEQLASRAQAAGRGDRDQHGAGPSTAGARPRHRRPHRPTPRLAHERHRHGSRRPRRRIVGTGALAAAHPGAGTGRGRGRRLPGHAPGGGARRRDGPPARAAAGGDRRQGEGREVDAAQRPGG